MLSTATRIEFVKRHAVGALPLTRVMAHHHFYYVTVVAACLGFTEGASIEGSGPGTHFIVMLIRKWVPGPFYCDAHK